MHAVSGIVAAAGHHGVMARDCNGRLHPPETLPMLLQRTEKARHELSPGVRTLSLRERSLLLLVDGKPLPDLQAMYHGVGAQIVENLIRQGYLAAPGPARAQAAPSGGLATLPPEHHAEPPGLQATGTAPGDAHRSVAGARMYLFDTCERLFARRDPVLAQHFRDALRAARDVESMLDVGHAMIEEVELTAGAERADTLRERLDQLLPAAPAASLRELAAAAALKPAAKSRAGGPTAHLPASLLT